MRRQCNRCSTDGEKLLAPDGFPRESDKPFSELVGSPSVQIALQLGGSPRDFGKANYGDKLMP